jgi:transposase
VLSVRPCGPTTVILDKKGGSPTMTENQQLIDPAVIVVGVDTHKDVHAAAALDHLGRRLDQHTAASTPEGVRALLAWARKVGGRRVWGIEGTGSYGATLTAFLRANGETVFEVARPTRRLRRDRGKSDPIDADAAARAVLAGEFLGAPKATDQVSESLRQIRATRRAAVKARTQAANLLQALLVTAPEELRASLDTGSLRDKMLRCSRLRPAAPRQPRDACKTALRSTARRWLHLDEEIAELTTHIADLTADAAPALRAQLGVGPDVAATLLIAAGGNPDRLRTEASFAALCGVNPIPASSGKTRRHRLNRGGDRQANAALHTVALVRMRSDPRTMEYAAKRVGQGLNRRDIMRCLKRYIARELYPLLLTQPTT